MPGSLGEKTLEHLDMFCWSKPGHTVSCSVRSKRQFFGLFGISNRASSMVGPHVVQAIIDKTQNNWQGFPFLFGICTAVSLVIWFGVDVAKGRRDAVR